MTYLFYFLIWYLSGLIPLTIMWYRSKEDLEFSGLLILVTISFGGFIGCLLGCLFDHVLTNNVPDFTIIKRDDK